MASEFSLISYHLTQKNLTCGYCSQRPKEWKATFGRIQNVQQILPLDGGLGRVLLDQSFLLSWVVRIFHVLIYWQKPFSVDLVDRLFLPAQSSLKWLKTMPTERLVSIIFHALCHYFCA